jgi:hypothetical protein
MSEITSPPTPLRRRRPLGATLWFLWMILMWVAFFALLAADRLGALWSDIRDLPLLVEGILWLLFFPWMLGTAVWTGPWPAAVRVILVACFAAGWTIVSIPRQKPAR